jgi:plastocyanin
VPLTAHEEAFRAGNQMTAVRLTLVLALSTLIAGCGSSGTSGNGPAAVQPTPVAPTPSPAPLPPSNTVTITTGGVDPAVITVAAGARVMFINRDILPHDVAGGPDPQHRDCLEIDAVGFLTTGQSRETAPLTTPRTCDYHDHSNHSTIFNGRIIIR